MVVNIPATRESEWALEARSPQATVRAVLFFMPHRKKRRRWNTATCAEDRAPHVSSRCDQPPADDADVRCSVHAKLWTERVSEPSIRETLV